MGGRGASMFSTTRTRRDITSRLDELDRRIKNIDNAAKIFGRRNAESNIQNAGSWFERMSKDEQREWAEIWRKEGITDFYEGSDRGQLITERKKLRKELAAIRSGQRTLFG